MSDMTVIFLLKYYFTFKDNSILIIQLEIFMAWNYEHEKNKDFAAIENGIMIDEKFIKKNNF